MSARVMAVWCPDWPTVAAARAGGHGLHLPLAVVGPRGVLACNAVARAVGVRRGLRRREAQFRCPELVVVAADPDRDAVWFEPVVQALDAVVPGIEVLRPGLFVFSAAGALRFHGGVEQVVTRVVDAVAAAGAECQVGLADELPTAVLGARSSALLEAGADAAYLADLPVDALVVESALGEVEVLAELVGLLRRLGVRTLGDFAALPARDVATRFGEAGAVAHRIARAVPWRPPSVTAVPTGAALEHRCDPPLERIDEAAFLGRRLAGEMHAALAAAGLACLRLSITARVEGGAEVERVWRCATPLTPDATADRLRWQLEGWLTGSALAAADRARSGGGASGGGANGGAGGGSGEASGEASGEETVAGGAITALVLEPVEVVPAGRVQEGLWGEAGLAEARVHRALVRVQGLLGPESVRVPLAVGGRGPAERVRSLPYGDAPADDGPQGPWPGALPAPSPSVVWPGEGYRLEIRESPEPDSAVATAVTLGGGVVLRAGSGEAVGVGPRGLLTGRPEVLEVGRTRCALLGWSRPWPLDEAWWEPGPDGEVRRPRARMQVVPERAAALLLGCVLGDDAGRWTVEGVYE